MKALFNFSYVLLKASGEVMFTTDVPMRPNEAHAAFVLSEMVNFPQNSCIYAFKE